MIRAIKITTQQEADALRARVDASHGYPRCERLAGRITQVGGGVHATCTCADEAAPDPSCSLATRAETLPVELADGTWAYPVREGRLDTTAALSAQEQAAIVDVADIERAASAGEAVAKVGK